MTKLSTDVKKAKSKLPTFPDGQRIAGGGKFKSGRQRRFMWAVDPVAAEKWAHNLKTVKPDWVHPKPKHKSTKIA